MTPHLKSFRFYIGMAEFEEVVTACLVEMVEKPLGEGPGGSFVRMKRINIKTALVNTYYTHQMESRTLTCVLVVCLAGARNPAAIAALCNSTGSFWFCD